MGHVLGLDEDADTVAPDMPKATARTLPSAGRPDAASDDIARMDDLEAGAEDRSWPCEGRAPVEGVTRLRIRRFAACHLGGPQGAAVRPSAPPLPVACAGSATG